jgi:hypothetical protein
MSTSSAAFPLAESQVPNFVADLVFNEPTLINAPNGDYLDLLPSEDGSPAQFVIVPVTRLRHAFRLHRVEDTLTRESKVELEAVPLTGGDTHALQEKPRGHSVKYLMDLSHNGCLGFALTIPKADPSDNEPMLRATESVFAPLLQETPSDDLNFTFEVNLVRAALTAPTTGFPTFSGDSKRAFDYIESRLGVNPHSETVDSSSLSRVARPSDIPEAAWTVVMDQLHLEVHYRRLCDQYFQAFREFNQNVFIANAGLVNTVGSLIELESNQSKIIHLGIEGMFGAISKGIGALNFPGSGVVSGALGLAFQLMLKDQGPGARDLAVAYNRVRDELTRRFNGIITQAQRARIETFADWGKLRAMGESMEMNGGKNRWPGDDSELRNEAARLMEVSLWKDMLKIKWHHMTASDAPRFMKKFTEENARSYEAVNKNYWVEFTPGKGAVGFKMADGFLVTNHWLGYGSSIFTHHGPSKAMCERLFGDRLKIARKDVFTDSSWNLTRETFDVHTG